MLCASPARLSRVDICQSQSDSCGSPVHWIPRPGLHAWRDSAHVLLFFIHFLHPKLRCKVTYRYRNRLLRSSFRLALAAIVGSEGRLLKGKKLTKRLLRLRVAPTDLLKVCVVHKTCISLSVRVLPASCRERVRVILTSLSILFQVHSIEPL